MPHLLYRSLPMTRPQKDSEGDNFSERDIMYKLLFDMKNDLNYLKTVIAELIKNNNLSVPNSFNFNTLGLPSGGQTTGRDNALTPSVFSSFANDSNANYIPSPQNYYEDQNLDTRTLTQTGQPNFGQPIIIQKTASNSHNPFESQVEIVDESLDMAAHEKALILKALKKHTNRRKDAADDLGISERTLYRKIKEYNLE
jgi:DNA-binding protein Fis